MVKKYTISVPDADAERIDRFKGQFNVSETCRKALLEKAELIERQETRMNELKGESNMNEVIERLKKERKELEEVELIQTAKEQGFEWAKNASYKEVRKAYNYEPHWQFKYRHVFQDVDGFYAFCKKNLFDLYGEEEVSDWLCDQYVDAWLEGVVELWEEIKDKVEA